MSEISEIKSAIKEINKFHKKIIILHCVSDYPTNLKNTELYKINELKKAFKNYLIGISDHTNDNTSSLIASTLGIVAIEKHFKLNSKEKTIDSKFSIDVKQLKKLRNNLDDIFLVLKKKKKKKNDLRKKSILRRKISKKGKNSL